MQARRNCSREGKRILAGEAHQPLDPSVWPLTAQSPRTAVALICLETLPAFYSVVQGATAR